MKTEPPAPSAAILEALAQQADGSGFIELPDFIQTALYHPTEGYYRRDAQRVGKNAKSDFYTSTSLKEAFADIVTEAAVALLENNSMRASETAWVELGAEPGQTLLEPEKSPFRSVQTVGAADEIKIPRQSVVFSNELFDAQPFRQIRYDGKDWQEFGVRIEGAQLDWARRRSLSEDVERFLNSLPRELPAGYTLDLPTGAAKLASSIIERDWIGCFIAFDYGKTWRSLLEENPQGSARAYYKHQQLADILSSPGQMDITLHICWDHLEAELTRGGFREPCLQSQEAFIIRRAPRLLQKAFDPSLDAFSPLRQKLKELVHPALMGQKFQALTAVRHG